MSIRLTPLEAKICATLHKATKELNGKHAHQPAVELRIAGGWVRDKLLGLESHDLDVAVANMMGHAFATHLNAYLAAHGHTTKTVARISSNPEQSKHLETATTQVFGVLVDFVNLRSETYSAGSRIPAIASVCFVG
jgi:tRNA nucleotidyltransferase (CCA-adding enzyme)